MEITMQDRLNNRDKKVGLDFNIQQISSCLAAKKILIWKAHHNSHLELNQLKIPLVMQESPRHV